MTIIDWIRILSIITSVFAFSIIFKTIIRIKSSFLVLIGVSLIFYMLPNLFYLLDSGSESTLKWMYILCLCSLLSSLFGYIRDSKPIFARFPIYLIFLPFVLPFFLPLILDQYVLIDLLMATLQGGCVVVALLMFSIHQIRNRNVLLQLISSFIFLFSYIIFWFIEIDELSNLITTQVLLTIGIILLSVGIKNQNKAETNVRTSLN